MYGDSNAERIYRKASIVQLWLLGYELPETLLIAFEKKFCIYASSRKSLYFHYEK